MAIEITTKVRNFLSGLVGMPDDDKRGIIEFFAQRQGLDAEDLIAASAAVEASEAEKLAEEEKKRKRKVQAKRDEEVRAEILSMNLDTDRSAMLAAVSYAESRNKRVWVKSDGTLDTDLKASRRGQGGGNGRPKADAPTGYANADTGEEILGGMATFVKENENGFSSALLDALYTEGGNLRTRDKVIAALVEHEVIVSV